LPLVWGGEGAVLEGVLPFVCRLSTALESAVRVLRMCKRSAFLIRDGINICNMRVRPTKQKAEPVQCMKCRKWGHFASDCQADKDTCGTCRDSHRTNAFTNKGKVYCVSCGNKSHSSWDRACPEFNQRCAIQDERNPENVMPFYPTEHNWTLTARPHRIPLDERFLGRYVVNSLPTSGSRWPGRDLCLPRKANGPNAA